MAKTPQAAARKKATPAPAASSSTENKPRRLKVPKYKSFALQKRIKRPAPAPLPGSFQLFRTALGTLKRNWKLFVSVALIFGFFNLVLVTGFTVVDLRQAKESFGDALHGQLLGQLTSGVSLFLYMLGSAGDTSSSPAAGVYRLVLGIILSLALIWMLRQLYAGNKVRLRDAFYQGMYPLIPFVLVLLVLGLQLIPTAAGIVLYSTVMANGIAISVVEQILWSLILVLLMLWSIYMLCSSLFALFIVSLPNMMPMAALRSARQLVLHRRWTLVRKVFFLPVALLVVTAVIMTPLVLFATAVAPWVFLVLSTLFLPIIYSYLYALYRSLL